MNIKRIIREEVDDFDWMRDITPGVDFFINKALYFKPGYLNLSNDYNKLVKTLEGLGFSSRHNTPPTIMDDDSVSGLYIYRGTDGMLYYVYTIGEGEDEDEYYEHIVDYALHESEDEYVEVIDAKEFIKLL